MNRGKVENRRSLKRTLRDVVDVSVSALQSVRKKSHLKTVPNTLPSIAPAKAQVICVASGKGGTGKTIVTTNLSILLAREGLRVLLLDADLGMANAHLLLGVSPKHDISSLLAGDQKLEDILVTCAEGVQLIPGGSGFSELAELQDWRFRYLAGELRKLEEAADILLVDLSAGISPQVVRFLNAAHEIILVTTPDITALIDAYATIKSLVPFNPNLVVKLIMNRARNEEEAMAAFQKLKRIATKHLKSPHLSYFGWLPHNFYIQNSVVNRKPVVLLHPMSFVTQNLQKMAIKLKSNHQKWIRGQVGRGKRSTSFFAKLEQSVFE